MNWTYWGSRFVRQDSGAAFNQFCVKPHNAVVELRPSFTKMILSNYCEHSKKNFLRIHSKLWVNYIKKDLSTISLHALKLEWTTATQDDWQRQCAIVMSGKIRYDTLVLELFRVVISQLYAQLILKTNLSQQSYSYLSQNNLKWKYIHWNSILQKWLIIYWNEIILLQNDFTFLWSLFILPFLHV